MTDRRKALLISMLSGLAGILIMMAFTGFIQLSPAKKYIALPFTALILMILVILFSAWRTKYSVFKGEVSFIDVVLSTLTAMLTYVVGVQIFIFLFLNAVGVQPDYRIGKEGDGQATVLSPVMLLFIRILANLLIGFIFSSLVAGLMKKNRPEEISNPGV